FVPLERKSPLIAPAPISRNELFIRFSRCPRPETPESINRSSCICAVVVVRFGVLGNCPRHAMFSPLVHEPVNKYPDELIRCCGVTEPSLCANTSLSIIHCECLPAESVRFGLIASGCLA